MRDVLARCLPSRVSPYLFEGAEVRSEPFGLSALRDLVQRNSQDLTAGVQRVFQTGWPQSDADVTAATVLQAHVESFVDHMEAVVTRLHRRLRWAMEQIRRLNVRRERQGTLDPEDETLFRRCDRLVKRLKGTTRRSRSQAEGHDDFNREEFRTAHAERCGRAPETIGFYADVTADALSLPGCEDATTAYSVLEALRFGAARVLDMHMDDLQILVIGHVERDDVDAVLWDPMPGGSGLLEQLRERFAEVVQAALKVVEHCPAVCGSSCIDCLQTFRNAYYHRFLERAVAKERIEAWGWSLSVDHAIPDESDWEWVEFDAGRSLRPGMFVAQVVGKSMEPRIPDGAYCLFASPVTGTRQGRTVLVRLRDAVDPDTGERFTVKRYRSEKTEDEDGWRHVRIVLEPVNPVFAPIELKIEDEGAVAVVAELVEVIGSEPPV